MTAAIPIYVDYPRGSKEFKVLAVPKVGETVYVEDQGYRCSKVIHRLHDGSQEYGIVVVLENCP